MELHGSTLVVVADGARARIFREARRDGPLAERADWIAGLDRGGPRPAAHVGRVHDRMGHGSHTVEGLAPHDRDERDFLGRLAARIGDLAREEPFDELVVIAAPRALGVLRDALPPAAARRLVGSEAADRCAEPADAIREAVRALRRRSA